MLDIKKKCLVCSGDVELLTYADIAIDKCIKCEFQYIPEKFKYINSDHFSDYFDKRQENKHLVKNELRRKQYKIDVEFMSGHLTMDSPRVLDVGCSSGAFISEINQRYTPGYILGVDIDKSAIKFANANYAHFADFLNCDLLNVNKSHQFDLIVFRGTFQYLDESLHDSLRHAKSLLAKNGKIVIFSLPSTDAFLYRLLHNDWALFHPEMSLMFNERSIKHLLFSHGFKIDDISYPYLNDVYSNVENDYENVKQIIMGNTRKSNPFWGSLLRLVVSNKD